MARGWESKSVEAQQAEAGARKSPSQPRLTPEQIRRKKQVEGLDLARRQVLQQLTRARDPRHQDMLRQALADLEAKIRELIRES
jgi:hypothetical protein